MTDPFKDYQQFLSLAHSDSLRFIVSNTTEAGIEFDSKDTDYATLPKTFPGKLTAFLFKLFNIFNGPPDKGFIVIPVELIVKNGDTLKKIVQSYSDLWNLPSAFKKWVDEHNVFCNKLVDRIAPGFPKNEIDLIQKQLGFADKLVVMAEPFHFWAIEAPDFVRMELPFRKVGLKVLFAKDLTFYRIRKVRILNGAHTAMVPLCYLRGFRTVKECVEVEPMASYVRKVVFEEIVSTLDLPKMN